MCHVILFFVHPSYSLYFPLSLSYPSFFLYLKDYKWLYSKVNKTNERVIKNKINTYPHRTNIIHTHIHNHVIIILITLIIFEPLGYFIHTWVFIKVRLLLVEIVVSSTYLDHFIHFIHGHIGWGEVGLQTENRT